MKLCGLTKLNFISHSSLHVHFGLTRRFVFIKSSQASFWKHTSGLPKQGGENGWIISVFRLLFKSDTLPPFTFYRPKQVIWLQLTSKKIVLPYAWKSEWDVRSGSHDKFVIVCFAGKSSSLVLFFFFFQKYSKCYNCLVTPVSE